MKKNPNKKTIFITGVSGSIGNFLAEHYIKKNYNIVGFDSINPQSTLIKNNDSFKFILCDLTENEFISKKYKNAVAFFGSPDVLINNAGMIYSHPVITVNIEGKVIRHAYDKWKKVIDSTLSSAFYMTTLATQDWVEHMLDGVIVNISSISANGNPGQAAYSSAKAGLNGLTIACSKELAQYGIRCISIAPGFINTDSTHAALSDENLKKIKKKIPLKRLGELSELSSAIDFAINNQYLTGTILELDGGLSI